MIARMADGGWAVPSQSGDHSYRVTLLPVSCSCPHFVRRLAGTGHECKHVTALRAELAERTDFEKAAAKAERLSDSLLEKALERYQEGPIAGAIRIEQAKRRLFEIEQEALKDLWR